MTLRRLAAMLLLGGGSLCADTVILQEVESAGGRGEMTIRFHEGKIRTDLSESVSTLFDAATGETINLQHHGKTFSRLTRAQSEELVQKLKQAAPAGAAGKLEATGQKQTISGYATNEVAWTISGLRFRFWVTRDFPEAEKLNALLDKLQASGPAKGAAALLPSRAVLPGVRLRTEMENGTQHLTYTLLSVAEVPADESLFRIPAGYKELPFAVSPESPAVP